MRDTYGQWLAEARKLLFSQSPERALLLVVLFLCCGAGLAQPQAPPRATSASNASNHVESTSFWPQAELGLLLNVIGGVLTVLAVEAWKGGQKQLYARKFKRVYGDLTTSCSLVYGSLSLHARTQKAINTNIVLSLTARAEIISHPLGKPADVTKAFSAERIASASEIRCVSYVAESLSRYAGVSAAVVSDESIAEKIDLNFVSFGVLNNQKTLDAFSNPANKLMEYDIISGTFVSKATPKQLHPAASAAKDYGIILKMHPEQFSARCWIVCAGINEWGTSGAAWYLSHKWLDLFRQIRKADQSFVAVLEVVPSQDDQHA